MTRCGECARCIDAELRFLANMEESLFAEAAGDVTKYLNYMGAFADEFNESGGVL